LLYLGHEATAGADEHRKNSLLQENSKALGSGPDPARMPRGHGIRPAAQGAQDASLGNYSTVATPDPKEKRKNKYLHHLHLKRMMFAREAALLDELKALRGLQEAPGGVEGFAPRVTYLAGQIKVSRHSSRLCGDRMVPDHGTRKNGTKYKTGAPGHVRIDRYGADRADYVWIRRCGSVWFCLGCATKIYGKRREELQQAFTYFQDKKKTYSFVTLTHPHTNKETLANTMERLGKAVRALRTGKAWTLFKEKYGLEHIIRATEVTYSDTAGFHPHFHMLFVYDREAMTPEEVANIEQFLRDRWSRICIDHGFIANDRKRCEHLIHGVDVQTGVNPVDWEYLAKIKVWEMASTTSKTPRKKDSLSPWNIFEKAQEGDPKYQALWWDFMEGMRGRAAIRWSPGLKQLVGVEEKTDDEIVQGKQAELVYIVEKESFRKIVKTNSRVRVLEAVEAGLAGDVQQCSAVEDEFELILAMGEPPG